MSNLAIIPARGGSKRIPKKNIKHFLGIPILAYSIKAALESKLFEKVIVSTDSDEIADVAKYWGAETPFKRSEENSSDFATTIDVIKEVNEFYDTEGVYFTSICCIYPCAPFVTAKKLKDSYDLMLTKGFDSVFPVVKYGFPIQRALQISNDKLSFIQPEYELYRSQDLESSFHDAGQFYWLNNDRFKINGKIVSENSGAFIVSELEAQDIDNAVDWKIAELKYELLK